MAENLNSARKKEEEHLPERKGEHRPPDERPASPALEFFTSEAGVATGSTAASKAVAAEKRRTEEEDGNWTEGMTWTSHRRQVGNKIAFEKKQQGAWDVYCHNAREAYFREQQQLELALEPYKVPVILTLSPEARMPWPSTKGGLFDLCSSEDVTIAPASSAKIATGVTLEMPPGYYGVIYARSSISLYQPIAMNVAILDSNHDAARDKEQVTVIMRNVSEDQPVEIGRGQKIAQLAVCKRYAINYIAKGERAAAAVARMADDVDGSLMPATRAGTDDGHL